MENPNSWLGIDLDVLINNINVIKNISVILVISCS